MGGPWRWDGAREVLVDELWDTVERRGGFFGHVTLSGLPMLVFGSISFVLWMIEPFITIFSSPKGGCGSDVVGGKGIKRDGEENEIILSSRGKED